MVGCELEPKLEKMPGAVKHKGKNFRRLAEKTDRTSVLTCFGNIELSRARYRQGRDGKTIFPLELLLGIEAGFTPAAANMIGKQFATSGSSQRRTKEMILERTGVSIGNEKLRKLTSLLAESFEPLREATQLQELMQLIKDARKRGKIQYFPLVAMESRSVWLHGASLKWPVWQASQF